MFRLGEKYLNMHSNFLEIQSNLCNGQVPQINEWAGYVPIKLYQKKIQSNLIP